MRSHLVALLLCMALAGPAMGASQISIPNLGCKVVASIDFLDLSYTYYDFCDAKDQGEQSLTSGSSTLYYTPFEVNYGNDKKYSAKVQTGASTEYFIPSVMGSTFTSHVDASDKSLTSSVAITYADSHANSNSTVTFMCVKTTAVQGLKSFSVKSVGEKATSTLFITYNTASACSTKTDKIDLGKLFKFLWSAGWKYMLVAFLVMCGLPCCCITILCTACCCVVRVCCCSPTPKRSNTLYQPLAQNDPAANFYHPPRNVVGPAPQHNGYRPANVPVSQMV